MNLYLISQTINRDYDTFDSAVVAAEDEDAARNTPPYPADVDDPYGDNLRTWCAPQYVRVKYIGEAAPELSAGVVLASFNAG